MKEKKIMLPTMSEAKRFVDEAAKCDFDIDVFYNRVTIDAKSILGVLSLDLTRILTVQFNGENQGFELSLIHICGSTASPQTHSWKRFPKKSGTGCTTTSRPFPRMRLWGLLPLSASHEAPGQSFSAPHAFPCAL